MKEQVRPAETRHRRPGSKSYAEIQNLSLEERLAYYKQQYQNEGGQAGPSQTTQVPKAPVKKVAAMPVAKEQDQNKSPEKKLGFFTRFFKRKK